MLCSWAAQTASRVLVSASYQSKLVCSIWNESLWLLPCSSASSLLCRSLWADVVINTLETRCGCFFRGHFYHIYHIPNRNATPRAWSDCAVGFIFLLMFPVCIGHNCVGLVSFWNTEHYEQDNVSQDFHGKMQIHVFCDKCGSFIFDEGYRPWVICAQTEGWALLHHETTVDWLW